ncbi:aminodeoxychorismate synthase component I [Microbacterium pseudoresistens]|uniref:aminodeoxychorismate synthase n=1 Tax=Microbacterium pseudoresistens TaxID=640634 RepID=A0A7Y9EXC3_9MICO|nr:aminodeoxychorismate synthase component I [Microbacterium pseudoresistens]NYD54785.1 para-aminobenzoate synthetase [Microbacterium pseudoresistens]
MIRTLLLDNHDSFTFNLFHQLAQVTGCAPRVVRNDDPAWDPAILGAVDAVVISPGPGDPRVPADFGVCAEVIRSTALPLLGVCLGHQGIAHAHGGSVVRAPEPRHGRPSTVVHDGMDLFAGLPSPLEAVRYHSLMVADLPPELRVTATADDGVVMGLRHTERPQWGVQFHPESIGTVLGTRMIENFAGLVRETGAVCGAEPGPKGAAAAEPAMPAHVAVRSVPLTAEPADVFSGLFGAAQTAVWLDGNAPGDPRARFSVMGATSGPYAGPLARTALADVHAQTVTIEHAGRREVHTGGFFDWLDDELHGIRVDASDVPGGFALGWVGWLGYELRAECGSAHERRSDLPDAALAFLDRALVIDREEGVVHLLALSATDGATGAGDAEVRAWFVRVSDELGRLPASAPPTASEAFDPPIELSVRHDRERYLELIRECHEQLAAGESYEVCLTNMIEGRPAAGAAPFDPLSVYRMLRATNPAPFGAFLRLGGASVLSTSPERFLRITAEGEAESSPIKGTRPRGATPGEDAAIRAELLTSEKDRAENLMIVDLVRHDLGRTAEIGSVHVDGLFRVESYATVHQLVSTVRSTLRDDASPVSCVRAAFPPGSMTGAPKERTMDIIDRLERGARGVYSGAIGFFSLDGAVDLSVVIRTLVVQETPDAGQVIRYGVGGAIVTLSEPVAEHAETVVKAAPLLRLLDRSFPD